MDETATEEMYFHSAMLVVSQNSQLSFKKCYFVFAQESTVEFVFKEAKVIEIKSFCFKFSAKY